MEQMVQGSNLGGARDFLHLSRPALGPTQLPVKGVPGLSRGKEQPGRDADPSPPSSAVVMKEYSYTSTPSIGRTACTEPQCLYKSDLYLYLFTDKYPTVMTSGVARLSGAQEE
jgi:hypothetical protein